jgi:hypothetical protein
MATTQNKKARRPWDHNTPRGEKGEATTHLNHEDVDATIT